MKVYSVQICVHLQEKKEHLHSFNCHDTINTFKKQKKLS